MATIIQAVDGVVTNKFTIVAKLSFGRAGNNSIQIDDPAVSNNHAQVICTPEGDKDKYFLIDLNSTNGSFLNEKQIKEQQLHHKDSLRIGWNIFTFIDEDEIDLEKTHKIKKSWIPGVYYSK